MLFYANTPEDDVGLRVFFLEDKFQVHMFVIKLPLINTYIHVRHCTHKPSQNNIDGCVAAFIQIWNGKMIDKMDANGLKTHSFLTFCLQLTGYNRPLLISYLLTDRLRRSNFWNGRLPTIHKRSIPVIKRFYERSVFFLL